MAQSGRQYRLRITGHTLTVRVSSIRRGWVYYRMHLDGLDGARGKVSREFFETNAEEIIPTNPPLERNAR